MADNEAQRKAKQAEDRATMFGNDPEKLRSQLTTTTTRDVKVSGGKVGKDRVKSVTRTKFRKEKFDQAKVDFEARAGSIGEVEAQNRGAGGGSFSTEGDFGPGAIRLNTVTAVNSKQGGR